MDSASQPRSHVRFLSPPKKTASASRSSRIAQLFRGAIVVLRRRGLRYYGYLVTGYWYPTLAYALLYGRQGARGDAVMSLISAQGSRATGPDGLAASPAGVPLDPSRLAAEPNLQAAAERALNAIHSRGLTGLTFNPGDVVLDEKGGAVELRGVTHLRRHRTTTGLRFRYWRDRDREAFNKRFGVDLLTEQSARRRLEVQTDELRQSTPYGGWYAGIDFGAGVTVGNFPGTDAGTGRWEYLNASVVAPLVSNKRVLDLGSNNGIMSVMMLRAGATEVVAVELSPWYAKASQLVREVFEWRDMRDYALRVENRSMLDVLTEDWGTFDVITAFCSLYCVEEESMVQIVRRAAELAPVMVLQANMPKPGKKAHDPRASAEFLAHLLKTHGFPSVTVFAPEGYVRPLLVGRREGPAQ